MLESKKLIFLTPLGVEGDQNRNLQALTRNLPRRIFIFLVPGKVSIFRLLGSTRNFRPEVTGSTRKFLPFARTSWIFTRKFFGWWVNFQIKGMNLGLKMLLKVQIHNFFCSVDPLYLRSFCKMYILSFQHRPANLGTMRENKIQSNFLAQILF